jgi:hypothetical protein
MLRGENCLIVGYFFCPVNINKTGKMGKKVGR